MSVWKPQRSRTLRCGNRVRNSDFSASGQYLPMLITRSGSRGSGFSPQRLMAFHRCPAIAFSSLYETHSAAVSTMADMSRSTRAVARGSSSTSSVTYTFSGRSERNMGSIPSVLVHPKTPWSAAVGGAGWVWAERRRHPGRAPADSPSLGRTLARPDQNANNGPDLATSVSRPVGMSAGRVIRGS